jgi:hypothetical protein
LSQNFLPFGSKLSAMLGQNFLPFGSKLLRTHQTLHVKFNKLSASDQMSL